LITLLILLNAYRNDHSGTISLPFSYCIFEFDFFCY